MVKDLGFTDAVYGFGAGIEKTSATSSKVNSPEEVYTKLAGNYVTSPR
jgi:hypothetical protein